MKIPPANSARGPRYNLMHISNCLCNIFSGAINQKNVYVRKKRQDSQVDPVLLGPINAQLLEVHLLLLVSFHIYILRHAHKMLQLRLCPLPIIYLENPCVCFELIRPCIWFQLSSLSAVNLNQKWLSLSKWHKNWEWHVYSFLKLKFGHLPIHLCTESWKFLFAGVLFLC